HTGPEVPTMQKLLPIFLALFATLSIAGILLVLTRTGAAWPRSIRTLDWRRITGTAPAEPMPIEDLAE
ncbi:MAG TPA: hypothetical protein VFI15_09095, partial [Candidatus Limnocylindrales bacterium]|nr:hypothetical protein [Candidatus Limnocylindrales bacterium]